MIRKCFQEVEETHGTRFLATINTKTTNIFVYEDDIIVYQEIQFFQIKVKDLKWAKQIYRIITETIPYPLFIRFVVGYETNMNRSNSSKGCKN